MRPGKGMPEAKVMAGPDAMEGLLKRLADAKFTGTLRLQFDRGEVSTAELRHSLAFAEFQSRELPIVESAGQKKIDFA
jgi:hypothetical protein